MKLLFLSRWYPWPPDNGSKIRIYNLLRCLASHHQIDLISFTDEIINEDRISALKEVCNQVHNVPYRDFQPLRWKALLGFFSSYPRSVVDTSNREMYSIIKKSIRQNSYDAVIASEVDMIPYALTIPRSNINLRILEDLEITNLYEIVETNDNMIQKSRHKLMWKKWQNYLGHKLRDFDAYTLVSQQEFDQIDHILKKVKTVPRFVIPNGVNLSRYRETYPAPEENTLIYSGALTYSANFDAMVFFLESIMPLIIAQQPHTKLTVTGKTTGVPLEKLPVSNQINFTGYVEDIRPVIAQSWASIVPLRQGGGTRLKILESLALGTPVVATPKGAEGLELIPGEDLLIASSPSEFAQAVLELLSDPDLRQRLSIKGRQAVQQYDWSIIGEKLLSVIEVAASRQHKSQQSQSI